MDYCAGLAGVMCSRRSGMGPTSYNIVIVHWLNYGAYIAHSPFERLGKTSNWKKYKFVSLLTQNSRLINTRE